MTYHNLLSSWPLPTISTTQYGQLNPQDSSTTLAIQLGRWVRAGHLIKLKRGLYHIKSRMIDDFTLASLLYPQSYLTAETVLSHHSLIPDIATNFTSATTTTTNQFLTPRGLYQYSKLPTSLYFGFAPQKDSHYDTIYYQLANPTKAFLDYIYLRRLNSLDPSRIDLSGLDPLLLSTYLAHYPQWVAKVVNLCKS